MVAVLVVMLCVAAAAAQPSPAPIASTILPPTIANDPTGACANQEQAMTLCLDAIVSGADCEACISATFPRDPASCDDFLPICDGFTTCGCDACLGPVRAYVDCALSETVNCELDCENGGGGVCVAEQAAFSACVGTMDDTAAILCGSCVDNTTFPEDPASTCDVWQATICESVTTCPCGSCGDLLEAYSTCILPSITTDACVLEPCPIPGPCDTELEAFSTCFTGMADGGDACDSCVAGAFPDPLTAVCSDYQNSLCPALTDTCSNDCEGCQSEIQDLLQCSLPLEGLVDCPLDCLPTCPTQAETLQQCLTDSLGDATLGVVCTQCIEDALSQASTNNCNDLQVTACRSLATCQCVPDDCQSNLADYTQCFAADTVDSSCTIDCSIEATLTPTMAPVAPCADTSLAMQDCLVQSLPAANITTCTGCLDAAAVAGGLNVSAAFFICDNIRGEICSAINAACACDPCQDEIEQYYRCAIDQLLPDECVLDCAHPPTDRPTTAPTIPPPTSSARRMNGALGLVAVLLLVSMWTDRGV